MIVRETRITLSQCDKFTEVCSLFNEVFEVLRVASEKLEDAEARLAKQERANKRLSARLTALEPPKKKGKETK